MFYGGSNAGQHSDRPLALFMASPGLKIVTPSTPYDAIGRVSDQPVPAGGRIAWRKSVTLSLTVDHRAVDGAPAARFLATLADPTTLAT